jgi:hypothetical protein
LEQHARRERLALAQLARAAPRRSRKKILHCRRPREWQQRFQNGKHSWNVAALPALPRTVCPCDRRSALRRRLLPVLGRHRPHPLFCRSSRPGGAVWRLNVLDIPDRHGWRRLADPGDDPPLKFFVGAIRASPAADEHRLAFRRLEKSHTAGRRCGAVAQNTNGCGNCRAQRHGACARLGEDERIGSKMRTTMGGTGVAGLHRASLPST